VNVGGVSRSDVTRGQALVRPGQWHSTTTFDASLSVLTCLDHSVDSRGAYVAYIGSGEFPARLRLIGAREVEPGATASARFWLTTTSGIPLLPGDRYVLREVGRFETVGGGEVLDVEPVVPTTRARPSRSVSRVVTERGWVDAHNLLLITGERTPPTVGRWVVDPDALAALTAELTQRTRSAGANGVDLAALNEYERALVDQGLPGLEVRGGLLVDSAVAAKGMSESAERVLAGLERGGLSPEAIPPADRPAVRELERLGLAVRAAEIWFSASSVLSAVEVLEGVLHEHPSGFTVSEARDALGSSRKYVISLLTHFDVIGVTRRRGDRRIAGPSMGVRT
jgi:selenocysteine-specific elongation factor